MGRNIVKQGIDFDTITTFRVRQADGTYTYFQSVSYTVITDDEDIARTKQRGPLAGAARTRSETDFTQLEAALKSQEGIP